MDLVTDDILLRRPEPKDIGYLYQYRNDWNVIKHLGGFSKGYSVKDLDEWIDKHRAKEDEIIWIIAERQSDKCLGHAGLYNIDHRVRKAEFAIMIGDKTKWGGGIGTLVTRSVIEYGFRQLNLHRMYLTVLKANERAIKLYEKLGFKHEGVFRDDQFRDGEYIDVVSMAILEQEWKGQENHMK
jgi:ribosomal-protein-alanine N-acetyltransferase